MAVIPYNISQTPAPIQISGTPTSAIQRRAYSWSPTVTGGFGSRTFTLVGDLPPRMTFNPFNGTIGGAPRWANSASGLSITVTDGSGSATLSNLTIPVASALADLMIGGVPGNITAGQAYTFTPTVTGGSGTRSFTFSGRLANGLAFDATTGTISGTPTESGSSSFVIAVTDAVDMASFSGVIEPSQAGQPSGPSNYRVVLPRGRISTGTQTVQATGIRREARKFMPFLSVAPVGRLWFMFCNSYMSNASGGEVNGPTGWSLQAGWEINGQGVGRAIKFPSPSAGVDPVRTGGLGATTTGDATSYTPAAGEIFYGYVDPADFGLTVWPTNTNAWYRGTETFADGASVIQMFDVSANGAAAEISQVFATGGTLSLGSGNGAYTGGLGGGGFNFQPTAIIGLWGSQRLTNFVAIGDSIADGSSLTKDSGFTVTGGTGAGSGSYIDVAARAAALPYVKACKGQDGYSSRSLGLSWKTRRTLFLFADKLVDAFGFNSQQLGVSYNIAATAEVSSWAKASGVKQVIKTTVTPNTSSTDLWVLLANQTPTAASLLGKQYNILIQGNPSGYGVDLVADVRSGAASPSDNDKFVTNEATSFYGTVNDGGNAGGVHPTQVSQGLMAAPVTTAISAPLP